MSCPQRASAPLRTIPSCCRGGAVFSSCAVLNNPRPPSHTPSLSILQPPVLQQTGCVLSGSRCVDKHPGKLLGLRGPHLHSLKLCCWCCCDGDGRERLVHDWAGQWVCLIDCLYNRHSIDNRHRINNPAPPTPLLKHTHTGDEVKALHTSPPSTSTPL